jgi:hypothetical protein
MEVFKSIASVFVKMDGEEGETPAAPAETPGAPAAPPVAPALLSAGTTDPAAEGKLLEKLNKALAENNLEGIDFFEFRLTLEALNQVIADEPTRYRAALGSLMAQGARADHIQKTADHYLQVLDAKEASYGEYLAQQQKVKVDDELVRAEAFKRQIQEKSEAIARLTQEIGKLTESELAARNAATLAKAEVEANRATFASIKGRIAAEIQGVRTKLVQYTETPKA